MIAMLRPRRLAKDTQFSLLPDLVPAKELRPKRRRNPRVSPGQGSLFDATAFEGELKPKGGEKKQSESAAIKGRRARKGGEYVAGHFYKGGQWIPKAAIAAASEGHAYDPKSKEVKPKSNLKILALDDTAGTTVPVETEVRSQSFIDKELEHYRSVLGRFNQAKVSSIDGKRFEATLPDGTVEEWASSISPPNELYGVSGWPFTFDPITERFAFPPVKPFADAQDDDRRTINGRTYELRDGRWHRVDEAEDNPSPGGIPLSEDQRAKLGIPGGARVAPTKGGLVVSVPGRRPEYLPLEGKDADTLNYIANLLSDDLRERRTNGQERLNSDIYDARISSIEALREAALRSQPQAVSQDEIDSVLSAEVGSRRSAAMVLSGLQEGDAVEARQVIEVAKHEADQGELQFEKRHQAQPSDRTAEQLNRYRRLSAMYGALLTNQSYIEPEFAVPPAEEPEVIEPPAPEGVIGETLTHAEFSDIHKRIVKGEITADEVRQTWQRFQDSKDLLKQELNKRSKKELEKEFSIYGANQMKKAQFVDSCLSAMEKAFIPPGKALAYSPFTPGDKERAMAEALDSWTDDLIQSAAKERRDRIATFKKSIENPETLDEFQTYLRYKTKESLSPEQLERYEALTAGNAKEKRQVQAEQKAAIAAAEIEGTGFAYKVMKHTKTGADLHVVQLTSRVDKAVYQDVKQRAKSFGGYWSKFVNGFVFPSPEKAELFSSMQAVDGREIAQEVKRDRTSAAADRIQEQAQRLLGAADDSLNQDRLVNTHRRARMAASAEAAATRNKQLGETMMNVADAIRDGNVEFLDRLSTKAHFEQLESILNVAKYDAIRATHDGRLPESETGRKAELSDVRYVKYPHPSIHKEHLQRLLDKMKEVRGAKQVSARLQRKLATLDPAAWRIGFYHRDIDDLRSLVDKAQKAGIDEFDYRTAKESLQDYDRMQRIDIKNEAELRTALREYVPLRGDRKGIDKVAQMERNLIGLQIPGYFPTPSGLSDRIADMADIQPGHRVLEPSAGKGSLADAVLARGVDRKDLTTIELSSTLSEVLKAKQYEPLREDFLEHQGEYDRIVMNPPFENGQDIDHVRHAYEQLAPGGRMVAIMSEGPFFRSDKKASAFRDWLDDVSGDSEKLPEGSFKQSDRSTGVNTRVVVIDKPRSLGKSATSDAAAPSRTMQYTAYLLDAIAVEPDVWIPSIEIELTKTMNQPTKTGTTVPPRACFAIAGELYYPVTHDGNILLIKAGRKAQPSEGQLSMFGDAAPGTGTKTKVVNGKTYQLNANRRWERVDKPKKGAKRTASAKPKAKPAKGGLNVIDGGGKPSVKMDTVGNRDRKGRTGNLSAVDGGKKQQPSLQELFAQADEIGSKYQDNVVSMDSKRKADAIADESGIGEAVSRARGKVSQLKPKGKAQTKQPKGKLPFEVNGTVAGPKNLPDKVTEEQMLKLQSPNHAAPQASAEMDAGIYNELGNSPKEMAFKRSLMVPRTFGANNDSSLDRVKFFHNFDKQKEYSDKDVRTFADFFPQTMEGWQTDRFGDRAKEISGKIDHPSSVAGAEYGASIYSKLSDQQKDEFILQTSSGPRRLAELNTKSDAVKQFSDDVQSRLQALKSKGINDVEYYRLTNGQGNDHEDLDDTPAGGDDDLDLDLGDDDFDLSDEDLDLSLEDDEPKLKPKGGGASIPSDVASRWAQAAAEQDAKNANIPRSERYKNMSEKDWHDIHSGVKQSFLDAGIPETEAHQTVLEQMERAYGQEAPESLKRGGAIAPSGGKLTATPKATEPQQEVSGQDAIDEKYASDNPSDQDIDNWLQESAVESSRPDPARMETDVRKKLIKDFDLNPQYLEGAAKEAAQNVKDADSFAEAVYQRRQADLGRRGKWTPEKLGLWTGYEEKQLKDLERKATTGRSEASRAKHQVKYEKMLAEKERLTAMAEERAAQLNARDEVPRDEQIKKLVDLYNEKVGDRISNQATLHEQVKKGQKRAIKKAKEELITSLPGWHETVMSYGSNKEFAKNYDNAQRDTVRNYLRQAHQSTGGDSKTLGLSSKKPSLQELKSAYRQSAIKNHPDQGGSREEFDRVRGAYERLMDKHYPDMKKSLIPWQGWLYQPVETQEGIVLIKAGRVPEYAR